MSARTIHVTLECFVRKNGKYLMLHRNPSKRILPDVWMAPGGHLEFNEGLFEAAKREILEETGLKIKNIKIKATGVGHLQDIDAEIHFHHLIADYAGGKLHEKPEDGQLVWLTSGEIMKLDNLLAELKIVLPNIVGRSTRVISYVAVYDHGNHMTQFKMESHT